MNEKKTSVSPDPSESDRPAQQVAAITRGQSPPSGWQLKEEDRIVVVRTVQGLEAIRDVWNSWRWHPNADIDFYLEVLRSRPEIVRPHVLVLWRSGSPVAMLVGRIVRSRAEARLGYARLFGTSVQALTFIYGGHAGDLSAENSRILVSNIIESLRKGEAEFAEFRFVRIDTPLFQILTESPGFFMRDHFPQVQPHWSMRTPENGEVLSACMSAHERRQIRRRCRQLDSDYSGKVKIEQFRSISDLDRMCFSVEEIARKTYQRGLGVGFFDNNETRQRLRFEMEKGWLRAHIMYVNERPCSFWMGSVYNNVYYSGDVGFDPTYKKYGPGKQLLVRLLEDLCTEGVKEMDFGLGDAEWKQRLGNRKWHESTVNIFAPTLKGFTISACQTPAVFLNRVVKDTLERLRILNQIRSFWRNRAKESGQRHPIEADNDAKNTS